MINPSTSEDREALKAALLALGLALNRHSAAQDAKDALGSYASATEAVWWICAVDEQLNEPDGTRPGTSYGRAREASKEGRCISGLRWIRDRNTHQLPFTTGTDDRTFFDPRPGGVVHIASSATAVWRRTDRVRVDSTRKPSKRDVAQRQAYDSYVAERYGLAPLEEAQRWLENWARKAGLV